MTEIYLHIVARMADYMATHPYGLTTQSYVIGRYSKIARRPASANAAPFLAVELRHHSSTGTNYEAYRVFAPKACCDLKAIPVV